MDHDTHDGPEWLSIPDASEVSGVSIGTLLIWTREGVVGSQLGRGPDGEQRMVRIKEILDRVGDSPVSAEETAVPSASSALAPLMVAIPGLINDLADARDRAARAETKVEFLREKISELRSELDERGNQQATTVPPQPVDETPSFWAEESVIPQVASAPVTTEGAVEDGGLDPLWAEPSGSDATSDDGDRSPGIDRRRVERRRRSTSPPEPGRRRWWRRGEG